MIIQASLFLCLTAMIDYNDPDTYVICAVCDEKLTMVSHTHLKRHNMTLADYRKQYPSAPTRSAAVIRQRFEVAKNTQAKRKGVARTEVVKEKIRNTKKANPKPAWNKGVPKSEEYKRRQSEAVRAAYASGARIHPRLGTQHSDETIEQIRNKARIRNDTDRREAAERAAAAARVAEHLQSAEQTRSASGFICPPYDGTLRSHVYKRKVETVAAHHAILKQYGYHVIEVGGWATYNILHDRCGNTFDRTIQVGRSCLSHTLDTLCPFCFPRERHTSEAEQNLRMVIESMVGADRVYGNCRSILPNNRELDIYIPHKRLAIEFDGVYWHSEQAHADKHNILTKQTLAASVGIRTVHIMEDEWEYKRNIVVSRLASILGYQQNKIYARKCDIRNVDAAEAREFLEENHLQGADVSTHRIGAYYQGQLVSLMTFKRTNMVKGGDGAQWELSRFASKTYCIVVGVASRLLKHFSVNQTGTLISYSDNRWSVGSLYQTLGFKYAGKSEPSYWYIEPNTLMRKHRSVFMKHLLVQQGFDPNKTEHQIMDERGYLRIYDAGTTKWVKQL